MSRIGNKPVEIPDKVKVELKDNTLYVEGPKGKLTQDLPSGISMEVKENKVFIKRRSDSKTDKSLHGLMRTLVFNMIKGVTEGYSKQLEIVGVGFRAQMQGRNLNLQLGFSHPVIFTVPAGVEVQTPKPNIIVVNGIDKVKVGDVAAKIRRIFPPEPYKGKGIRYSAEYVRKKVGKAAATSGK